MFCRLGAPAPGKGPVEPAATMMAVWGIPPVIADCIAPNLARADDRRPPLAPAAICRIAELVADSIEDRGALPAAEQLASVRDAAAPDGESPLPRDLLRRHAEAV